LEAVSALPYNAPINLVAFAFPFTVNKVSGVNVPIPT